MDSSNIITLSIVIAGKDTPPLCLSLPGDATVYHLNDAIFDDPSTRLSKRLHRLRFIAAGKNVGPFHYTLNDAGIIDGSFVHCVVSDIVPFSETRPLTSESDSLVGRCEFENDDDAAVHRGLVTIDLGEVDDHEMTAGSTGTSTNGPHHHHHHHHHHGSTMLDYPSHMEDGTLHDWIWGFVLGVLLGLIMMILALDRSIALSAKWKRGIGYGTAVNMAFGVFLLATGKLN